VRPDRRDILDNFSPEQAEFVAELWESMPGAKLTARRSRRRPGVWEAKARSDSFGAVPYEVVAAIEGINNHAWLERFGVIHIYDSDWTWCGKGGASFWRSPAQLGREHGRMRKRQKPLSISIQTGHGRFDLVVRAMQPHDAARHAAVVVAQRSDDGLTRRFAIPPPFTVESLERATYRLAQLGHHAERIEVSPRTYAAINREMVAMRRYDVSFSP